MDSMSICNQTTHLKAIKNQNIKALINFAKFLGPDRDFYQLSKKDDILAFLNTKIKSKEIDPDGKWIRTWNDYLQRIKYFIRWLYNEKQRIDEELETIEPSDWTIPSFVLILLDDLCLNILNYKADF